MKPAALILAFLLASCAPAPESWQSTANPLDQPQIKQEEPTANGYWGPFGTAPAAHRNFSGSP